MEVVCMKKLFALILALICVLGLIGCANRGSEEPEISTDAKTENSGLTQHNHTECEFCGETEDGGRWFIAEAMDSNFVKPLGDGCFEAVAALDAGISLHYSAVDGDPEKRLSKGDVVRITYNGMIMESYPVQIAADSVEKAE
jgi:hypothetical protein